MLIRIRILQGSRAPGPDRWNQMAPRMDPCELLTKRVLRRAVILAVCLEAWSCNRSDLQTHRQGSNQSQWWAERAERNPKRVLCTAQGVDIRPGQESCSISAMHEGSRVEPSR